MKFHPCPDTKPHGQHEWYWKNILRRDCPGLPTCLCSDHVEMHTHPAPGVLGVPLALSDMEEF